MANFGDLLIGARFTITDGDGTEYVKSAVGKGCCGGTRWNAISSDNSLKEYLAGRTQVDEVE